MPNKVGMQRLEKMRRSLASSPNQFLSDALHDLARSAGLTVGEKLTLFEAANRLAKNAG